MGLVDSEAQQCPRLAPSLKHQVSPRIPVTGTASQDSSKAVLLSQSKSSS